jgi:uncharacterized membrane protein YkoI
MKRTSLFLLGAGAVAAVAITSSALAAGSQEAVHTHHGSLHVATATPTASPTSAAAQSASVSQGRAGEIALAHVGGGTLIGVEQEVEHGRTVWSVKVVRSGSPQKVYVDQNTGLITHAEAGSVGSRRSSDDKGGASLGQVHH